MRQKDGQINGQIPDSIGMPDGNLSAQHSSIKRDRVVPIRQPQGNPRADFECSAA
jgi:hypothetical protein